MAELQAKKAIRRNNIKVETLPQNLKDKYDELLDLAEQVNDDDLSDDERTDMEVRITAKDESLLRLVRRHARDLEEQSIAKSKREKGGRGDSKDDDEELPQEKKGVFNKYL